MGFTPSQRSEIKQHSTALLIWGLFLAVLGVFAIGATTFTTLLTVYIIGILLVVAGVLIFIDSFGQYKGNWTAFLLHIVMAIIYIIAGGMLIEQPLQGSISLTFILGIAYLALGVIRTYYALTHKYRRWGWVLFNGLITLLLGILILASWPNSSLWVIGLFVGIDLLFAGWASILIALAAKDRVTA